MERKSWQQLSALANARSPLRACGVAAKLRSFGTAICLLQPAAMPPLLAVLLNHLMQ